MPKGRGSGFLLGGLVWLLSSGVAFAQQGPAPMVITFPAPSEVGFPDEERPAAEVLNEGMFVFVGDAFCGEVDLLVAHQVEIGLEGQPVGCSEVGSELHFADFKGYFYALTRPQFESGTTFAFDGYAPVPSSWYMPQSVCDVLISRAIEPRIPCGRLSIPWMEPASGSCLTSFVVSTTLLPEGEVVQLFLRRLDVADEGSLVGSPTVPDFGGRVDIPIAASALAASCAAGGEYEVSFAFGDPPVAEKKSVVFTVVAARAPLPADAGNGGFVGSDSVGRTTAVIGLVILTVAVIAARFVTHLASGSHVSGRRR